MRCALAFVALAALACRPQSPAPPPAPPTVVELQGETMGTTYSIKVIVMNPEESSRVVLLQSELDLVLERVNDVMSTYRPESELSRFNKHSSLAPFVATEELRKVTKRALEIGAETEGAFDVTLGPLIDLWGFDAAGRRSAPPDDVALEAARARVGREKVIVEEAALRKLAPDLSVNLSGIAKGYGVDEVVAVLTDAGFHNLMVEVGGEVRALGHRADGGPWRLGINVPRSDAVDGAVLRAVPLVDAALATSGDYRNFFESGGKRYSHIIDPRTAKPVAHEIVSATVLAKNCMDADGYATAAMVLGATAATTLFETLPEVEGFFVEKRGDELRTLSTSGFPAE